LALLIVSVCLCTWSYAQTTNVANTSKRGSLIIAPEIRTDGNDTAYYKTLLTINNDYPDAVNLECCYVIPGCTPICGGGLLTASQPLTIDVFTGEFLDGGSDGVDGSYLPGLPYRTKAELKCWAIGTDSDNETVGISWNYLAAEVTIIHSTKPIAYTYNAWRFKAWGPIGTPIGTKVVPATGLPYVSADFTGLTGAYDACPKFLYFDILQQETANQYSPGYEVDNYISLVPCKQDFTQGAGATRIKVDLSIWNEDGANKGLLTSWLCIDCFFQGSLSTSLRNASGLIAFPNLGTPGGYFKTTTVAGGLTNVCPFTLSAGDAPPIIGVIDKTYFAGTGPVSSTTPSISAEGTPVTGALKYNYEAN